MTTALRQAQQGPDAPDDCKRIVVKVGSAVIAGNGRLRSKVIADLAYNITVAQHRGYEIVLVVSGAVAAGFQELGLEKPPTTVVERQASASVGQYKLMTTFAKSFAKHRVGVAQILMTEADIENRRRFLSARHTLQWLIKSGVVPIINENDPLGDDEAKIGDNDHLAALVTGVVSADLLILLSVVPGVYKNGQTGEIIDCVDVGSSIDEHITSSMSEGGVGGMAAKVSAARLASRGGVPTIIADGTSADTIPRLLNGESIGTKFMPRAGKLSLRKRWIALRMKSRGVICLDDGAKNAIVDRGASLLPSGITGVTGKFSMGERVDIHDATGEAVAVGLVSYSADEIRRMQGKRRSDYEAVLGYKYVDEIINRDDMVIERIN